MNGYVYILQCNDGSFYTGSTKQIELRLWQHQNGLGGNYTRKRLPVELVYIEHCFRIDDAYFREGQIKGWSRKKKQALIDENENALRNFAACQNQTHFENNPDND